MSVHWGGRGPGHTSRRTKKPGAGTPSYVAPTSLYYDNFNAWPDETIMTAAPGWQGWSSTGASTGEKNNAAVVGGVLTHRTTGRVDDFTTVGSATQSGKYLVGPNIAFRPNAHMLGFTIAAVVAGIKMELGGTDEVNKIQIGNVQSGSGASVFNTAANAPASLSGSSAYVSTGRFIGNSSLGPNSSGNAKLGGAGNYITARLFNGRLYQSRNGAPLNPLAGFDVSSYANILAGTRIGICNFGQEHRTLDDMLGDNLPGVLKFDETSIKPSYPRIQGLGGNANGARDITFTGTYEWDVTCPVPGSPSGKADPTGFFWGLNDPETGAVVLAPQWVSTKTITRTGQTGNIATGTWSITVRVPCGLNGRKPYRLRLICADATQVEWQSSRVFYVSYNILWMGQSNPKLMFNGSGASQPNHPGGTFYNQADSPNVTEATIIADNVWHTTTTDSGTGNAANHVSELLGAALNLPIQLTCIATGGVGAIALAPGGSVYSYEMRHMEFGCYTAPNSQTGVFDAIYYNQGEQEINAAYAYSWTSTVQTIVADMRSKCGQPNGTVIPFFYSLTGRYQTSSIPDAPRDARANALRLEQIDLFNQISDAYLCHHVSGAAMDGPGYPGSPTVHFSLSAGGYERWARRIGLTLRKVLAGGAYDGKGPLATTLTRTSPNNFEIAVNLNGATSLSGTALTGFEISINNFSSNLTISSIGVSSGKIVIVTTGDDGTSQAKVRNYRGFDPADSSNALGTYADGTTIEMFPIIAALAT